VGCFGGGGTGHDSRVQLCWCISTKVSF